MIHNRQNTTKRAKKRKSPNSQYRKIPIPKPLTNKSPEIPHPVTTVDQHKEHPTFPLDGPDQHLTQTADLYRYLLFGEISACSACSQPPPVHHAAHAGRKKETTDPLPAQPASHAFSGIFFLSLSLYLSDSLLKFENMFNSLSL